MSTVLGKRPDSVHKWFFRISNQPNISTGLGWSPEFGSTPKRQSIELFELREFRSDLFRFVQIRSPLPTALFTMASNPCALTSIVGDGRPMGCAKSLTNGTLNR